MSSPTVSVPPQDRGAALFLKNGVLDERSWQCRVCLGWKPVMRLARDCEAKCSTELGIDLEELLKNELK